jgi:hypothetical protein
MKKMMKKIWNICKRVFMHGINGVRKCWKCNYKEEGILMPWLLRQNSFLQILLGTPVFFFEHFVNIAKLVYFLSVISILSYDPLLAIIMLPAVFLK